MLMKFGIPVGNDRIWLLTKDWVHYYSITATWGRFVKHPNSYISETTKSIFTKIGI